MRSMSRPLNSSGVYWAGSGGDCGLQKSEPDEIRLGPPCLRLQHTPERLDGECVRRFVEGNSYSPAIPVKIDLMGAALPVENKAIPASAAMIWRAVTVRRRSYGKPTTVRS